MKDKTDMITMLTDSGESVDFYVLEETRINAVNYLLVTDAPEDQDGECYILKDVSCPGSRTQKPCMSLWKMTANWTALWACLKNC